MNNRAFVNRKSELEFFASDIKRASQAPAARVVLLAGHSGVGKSDLAGQVLLQNSHISAVKVRVLVTNQQGTEEGYYLRRIAEAFHERSRNDSHIPSLCQFNQASARPADFLDTLTDEIAEKIPVPGGKTVKRFLKKRMSRGEFSAERILGAQTSEHIAFLQDYVRHVLHGTHTILNIENIQSIDRPSLDFLFALLEERPACYLILEYTLGWEGAWQPETLVELARSAGAEMLVKYLTKLPFTEYLKLVRANPDKIEKLLYSTWVRTDGNLRQLVDLDVQLALDTTLAAHLEGWDGSAAEDCPQHTLRHLLALPSDALLVMVAIAFHGARVETDSLRELHRLSGDEHYVSDLDLVLEQLKHHELVVQDGNYIQPAHDQVASEICTREVFLRYRIIVGEMWIGYYERILSQGDTPLQSRGEILATLLSLLAQSGSVEKLYARFEDIMKMAIESRFPRRALEYLNIVRQGIVERALRIPQSITRKIDLALIATYYTVGLYGDALELLRSQKSPALLDAVYMAVLLDRLDRHTEAIEFCNDQLTDRLIRENGSARLSFLIVRMTSARSVNNMGLSRSTFDEIRRDRGLVSFPEYGYALRNSEIVLPISESIPLIRESVEHFRRLSRPIDEAHSMISLAMQLGRMGELDQARTVLMCAQEKLRGKSMEHHVILNDLAVLDMCRGDVTEDTHALLRQAKYTVTSSFDRIVTEMNMLIYLTLTHRLEEANRVYLGLMNMVEQFKNPDKWLERSVFYNCAFFLGKVDRQAREAYLEKARLVLPQHNKYWRHRLFDEPLSDTDYAYVSTLPFHPSYISHWHFTVNPELEN